jgi:ADP-heptose:LPS heptosyltransferase
VTPHSRRASPLRGRYLVQNRPWNAFLGVADRLLAAFVQPDRTRSFGEPRRVLLAVGGHLGDAVIATSAIAYLRRALPAAEIGMVLGSWARPAVEGHPDLRWIHTLDHWKLNRTAGSLAAKWVRYRDTRHRAVREIRAVGYDAAVDLYMLYPNMAWLLWRAGIPVRIGYTSGGYGPLYTHALGWSDAERHTAEQQASLLRVLAPGKTETRASRYHLPPIPTAARRSAQNVLRDAGFVPGEYIVFHMGSGSAIREWPREKWRQLAQRLTADGHRLAFTGTGVDQEQQVAEVMHGLLGCVNLSGRLGWQEFVHVLSCAKLVVSVETVAAHVAAAVGTPCVALWTGMTRLAYWRPLGSQVTVLTHPVSCAPCFRSRGCETMACVRDIEVDSVLQAVRPNLRPNVIPQERAKRASVGIYLHGTGAAPSQGE